MICVEWLASADHAINQVRELEVAMLLKPVCGLGWTAAAALRDLALVRAGLGKP
jgi:hypothetical protein